MRNAQLLQHCCCGVRVCNGVVRGGQTYKSRRCLSVKTMVPLHRWQAGVEPHQQHGCAVSGTHSAAWRDGRHTAKITCVTAEAVRTRRRAVAAQRSVWPQHRSRRVALKGGARKYKPHAAHSAQRQSAELPPTVTTCSVNQAAAEIARADGEPAAYDFLSNP